jgi:hypothetical protein
MRMALALRAVCLLLGGGSLFLACDTDAVGVQDCRDIERARCDAARFCDMRIVSDDEVAACKRFARDNCLHGFEVADTPSSTELRQCVQVIEAAGACAEQGGAEVLVAACNPRTRGLERVSGRRAACEVVASPEFAPQCHFLVAEPPEDPEPDAGQDPPPAPVSGGSDAGG